MPKLAPVQRKWREAEDEALIEACLAAPPRTTKLALFRAVAEKLGRSEFSVAQRYDRLKIKIDDRKAERELARLAPQPRFGKLKPATRPGLRKCLCCKRDFMSEGAHNRLCSRCRTRDVSPYAPGAC